MTSSKTTKNPKKDQKKYEETFYSCHNKHEYVMFTTNYCPMCELTDRVEELVDETELLSDDLDNCRESFENLVVKATNQAPELLI